jgi:hypothetical protein
VLSFSNIGCLSRFFSRRYPRRDAAETDQRGVRVWCVRCKATAVFEPRLTARLDPGAPVNVTPPVDNPLVRTRIGKVARALTLPASRRRRMPQPRWSDPEGERTARRVLYGERRAIDPAVPRGVATSALPRKTAT